MNYGMIVVGSNIEEEEKYEELKEEHPEKSAKSKSDPWSYLYFS